MSSDTADLRTEEHVLRKFFGHNPEPFLRQIDVERGRAKWGIGTMNWAVFIAPTVWFFYRKMYLIGCGVILIPILIGILFPDLVLKSGTVVSTALAFVANAIYVYHARRKISAIEKQALPIGDRDILIERAGGTSKIGATIGAALMIALIYLAIIGAGPATLPGCFDRDYRATAQRVAKSVAIRIGIFTDPVPLTEFKEISGDGKAERICEFLLSGPQGSYRVRTETSWVDETRKEFSVKVVAVEP